MALPRIIYDATCPVCTNFMHMIKAKVKDRAEYYKTYRINQGSELKNFLTTQVAIIYRRISYPNDLFPPHIINYSVPCHSTGYII